MQRALFAALLLSSMAGLADAQTDRYPPDRVFAYYDRDKNGKLDGGEYERFSSDLKEAVRAVRLDFRSGVDQAAKPAGEFIVLETAAVPVPAAPSYRTLARKRSPHLRNPNARRKEKSVHGSRSICRPDSRKLTRTGTVRLACTSGIGQSSASSSRSRPPAPTSGR